MRVLGRGQHKPLNDERPKRNYRRSAVEAVAIAEVDGCIDGFGEEVPT
jgi:hypothetical protein